MRTLQPLGNHVLIEPKALPVKTEGGIVLPEQWQQKPTEGVVIATGEGRTDALGHLIPTGLKPGDVVAFNWINGRDITIEGRSYKVMDAQEILGILV